MFRYIFIFTVVLIGGVNTACSPRMIPVQPAKPQAKLLEQPLKKPSIPHTTPLLPVKVQASTHASKPLLPSPFFIGLRASDLAWVQAQVKPSVSRHWHVLAQRSIWVRERILKGLKDARAPQDLQVVPIVESAYQPYALSRTGAMGLWQLMPKTAQGLGIYKMRNGDGRRHVEISTAAAAQYLMTQYKRFGNWPLAFAAYNMGPYGLSKRLKKTPWQLSDGIRQMPVPKETRNYVIRILGVTALLHLHVLTFPKAIHTVKVTLN
ncbi:MAG: lytic transglycosylase domain-containing protein, partial [Mariprofundaceae bacterium]|nr:lytic transglycosylase domain-containing protein [Mariprofundaceae bacterium]